MSAQKTITVHLEAEDYNRLEAEARRKGMGPDALVLSYVHDALKSDHEDVEQRKLEMLKALEELDQIAAEMPPFDAEALARKSREELERRSIF